MRRAPILFALLGAPGLLLALLGALGPAARRLLAAAAAGALGALFMGALVGNMALRLGGREDPGPALAAIGATAATLLAATAALVATLGLRAYRRAKGQAGTPAGREGGATASPAATSARTRSAAGQAPQVVVQGAPAEGLAPMLRALADLAGAPRVVLVVSPGKRPWGRRLEGGLLLRAPRPREGSILAALEVALQDASPAPPPAGERRPSPDRREGAEGQRGLRRPRPDDLAAAVGQGEGQ